MGTDILQALDLIQERKEKYKANGITYYRPWIFRITDGEPQGEDESVTINAAQRIKNEVANRWVAFFTVGVQGANMARMAEFGVRTPVKLKGFNIQEMFFWLSGCMQRVSQSKTDDQVALAPL